LCPEDDAGALERLEKLKAEAAAASVMASTEAVEPRPAHPEGVASVCG
jgi:hypothetical protein